MGKIRQAFYVVILAALACTPFFPQSITAQDRQSVTDVSLTIKDIRAHAQSPFKADGQTASVLFFILQDCPISNRYAPEIARIVSEYQAKNIRFYLVYVDPTVETKQIEAHLREFNLPAIPVIHDAKRLLVATTGVSVTPETAVVGKTGEILYRGRIDNLYEALGRPRRNVTERDLRNALDAVLQNRKVPVARTQAIGCYISAQN
ncbi:MAG: redoxin domain-containing protein [Acidobacteriota bacterium]